MKFEEILPYLRQGKKITSTELDLEDDIYYYLKYYPEEECYEFFNSKDEYPELCAEDVIINDGWELYNEKIKYYPVIYKNSCGIFSISKTTYSSLEEAIASDDFNEVMMLITEIHELIEERDE